MTGLKSVSSCLKSSESHPLSSLYTFNSLMMTPSTILYLHHRIIAQHEPKRVVSAVLYNPDPPAYQAVVHPVDIDNLAGAHDDGMLYGRVDYFDVISDAGMRL